jgi:hypothetical protein
MPDPTTLPTGEPDEISGEQPASAEPSEEEEAPGFANRAERRARGKGKSSVQAQPQGKGHLPGGRGSVQSPRQWGNRRTG